MENDNKRNDDWSDRPSQEQKSQNLEGYESTGITAGDGDIEEDYEVNGEAEDVIPNPEDFDEGDYEDTENTEDIEDYNDDQKQIDDAAGTPRL